MSLAPTACAFCHHGAKKCSMFSFVSLTSRRMAFGHSSSAPRQPRTCALGVGALASTSPRTRAIAVKAVIIDKFTHQVADEVDEETIEFPRVSVEQPGSVSSRHFEAHDQAVAAVQLLQQQIDMMSELLTDSATTNEADSPFDGLSLRPELQQEWKKVYRKIRKEDEKQFKEERKQKREQRRQQREAAASVSAASTPAVQQPEHVLLQKADPAERRARRALQREERRTAGQAQPAATVSVPAPTQQFVQPVPQQPVQPQQLQQQPSDQRLQRSTTRRANAAAPAGLNSSGSGAPAAMTANRGGPASTSSVQRTMPAAAAAAAASPGTADAYAASSNSSSLAPAVCRQPYLGFTPLSLGQPSITAPVQSASRRIARSSGLRTRGRTAAMMAPLKGPDCTYNNLDMSAELLSADQEKELALMVQDLLRLEALQRELLQSLGRPPSDLEWMEAAGDAPTEGQDAAEAVQAFMQRVHHGIAAKQAMVSANYKLVMSISRKYQGYGIPLGDLVNEGIAGLVKGVERFEPSKGCKFSTYAHWWIRQSITRSLSDQGRLVRLPSHMQELMTKMTKISRQYEAQYGRDPTLGELAKELGVDTSKIQDAYEAVFTPKSLDAPMADGEGATLGELVEDERTLGPEEAAYLDSLKHDMDSILGGLALREAGVLRMRFGLVDGVERTLDEIGAQYNVTRERIRQIEAKAIRQLRARQVHSGSVMQDYQVGDLEGSKQLASRTSSGTRKQS